MFPLFVLLAMAGAAPWPDPQRREPPKPRDPHCNGPDGCYMFRPGSEARARTPPCFNEP